MEAVEQEKEAANLAGTWQQFSLMTRGRREPRDPEQVPTRSVNTRTSAAVHFWYPV